MGREERMADMIDEDRRDGTCPRHNPLPRVRLVKERTPKLPAGSLGTVTAGDLRNRGMIRVLWDAGYDIPMFRGEVEQCD